MRLRGHGIEIDLPEGWEGRIYRRQEGFPILQAANFPLPARDGDFGGLAVTGMATNDIFAVLAEYSPELASTGLFERQKLPLPLDAADASPRVLQRRLPKRSAIQKFFTERGRPFTLYVVVGAASDVTGLVDWANHVLATLSIAPAP